MRVAIYTHDPMLNLIYSSKEVVELFGEEYLEEYGVEIPDDLALDVINTYNHLKELGAKLEGFVK